MAKKPLAVFDIDGTIFRSSLVIELTNTLIAAGIFPASAREDYRLSFEQWQNREGEYEQYIQAIIRTFAKYATGAKENQVQAIAEAVIAKLSRRTYRYTRSLIKELQSTHFLIAISGSPEVIVREFAKVYEFDDYSATGYEVKNGRYNGVFDRSIHSKDKTLRKLVEKHELGLEGSIGVGDTESDVPFMKLTDRPVAFNPNAELLETARKLSWEVVVERKDVIYKLETANDGRYELR